MEGILKHGENKRVRDFVIALTVRQIRNMYV
jgi:hypothetical protein